MASNLTPTTYSNRATPVTLESGGKPSNNDIVSQSIPTRNGFESSLQKDTSTGTPLATTTLDAHRFDLEDSLRDVHVTLSKTELRELLRCMENNPVPTLKEKLTVAAATNKQHQRRRERRCQSETAILSGATTETPKIIMKTGKQMPGDVVDFDRQTSSTMASLVQAPHVNPGKPVLCRQKSVLHVRSIDTPIPALLTPQPQRTHKKLEACNSDSSTDSGLSQCRSQRSSTVSDRSSSVFLSEDEDDQNIAKEDKNSIQMVAVSKLLPEDGQGTVCSQVTKGLDDVKLDEEKERIQKRSDECEKQLGGSKIKDKPRRQSESTRDVTVDKRERHETKKACHISRKRSRAISLPELPPLNPQSKTGMTIDWKIPRDDFIGPIFYHKGKTFEKKCRFSTGSGSSIINVQLAIRLFPNGINWDQGSYSTLKVEILSTSRPPSSAAYIHFDITGYDCHAGHVIASRQVEYPMKNKEFLIPEFLSHEVIKVSHARHFEFRAIIKVKYLVCRDWVLVAPDKVASSSQHGHV